MVYTVRKEDEMNNYQPCSECGELEAHELHHEYEIGGEHFDVCNAEASYEGEERGWVPSMDCHEYEPGCYCADAGKCEVCVERAIDAAEMYRDAMKEGV